MSFTVSFTGNVTKILEARAAAWASKKVLAARLTVPPELAWWYWNEFGTAGETQPAEFNKVSQWSTGPITGPTGAPTSYKIKASGINALELVFRTGEGTLFRGEEVTHPGIRPSRNVQKALPMIQLRIMEGVRSTIKAGLLDNPTLILGTFKNSLEQAKTLITEQMQKNMGKPTGRPPIKEDSFDRDLGRLEGRPAHTVFAGAAVVKELSE